MSVQNAAAAVAQADPMTERRKQLEETIDSLVNFVRAVLVLRALWEAKLPPQSFWIVLSNAVFDTAVIDWCKLFGSDDEKNQPTHWKNVVPNEDAFRQQLLAAVGVSWPEWLKYWAELKHYRDNAAAHHSTERRDIKTFPHYELALKAAQFYYERAAAMFRDEFAIVMEPSALDRYVVNFLEQATKFARLATDATRDWAEVVDWPRVR
jgi:hypothetical protein